MFFPEIHPFQAITFRDKLGSMGENNRDDAAELLPLVYAELRKLAQQNISNEGTPQTLSATALVHEAYLKISERETSGQWSDKQHFFSAAAQAMRRILVDRARAKKRIKRGGDLVRTELIESRVTGTLPDDELLAVDEALDEFQKLDAEAAELVQMRYFAGMTWAEISTATKVPERTLRRKWTYARTWLRERLDKKKKE